MASVILKKRYCRKHGHDIDPDPGDAVLYCRRCKRMLDVYDFLVDMREPGESFCKDCPDHEGCGQGYPCEYVKHLDRKFNG